MIDLHVEKRVVSSSKPLSGVIVEDMIERTKLGSIVVVSKRPDVMLSPMRREWLRYIRKAQNKRSATLNASKILAYTEEISYLQRVRFTLKSQMDEPLARVYLASPEQLLDYAPTCMTVYVAAPVPSEILHKITAFMPKDGLVIIYKPA